MERYLHANNAQKHYKNTSKMLGFSCFCMALAGRFFEISQVNPRRF
jgi:hypothetical protein